MPGPGGSILDTGERSRLRSRGALAALAALAALFTGGVVGTSTVRAQDDAVAPEAVAPDATAPDATALDTTIDPTTAEARAFFDQGRALADAHRYAEASEAFARSLSLVERPSTRFNLAVTLFAQGRHVETVATLETYVTQRGSEPREDDADQREATRMLSLARARIAEVSFEVLPTGATVVLDGRPLEGTGLRHARVDAGVHVVRVEHTNHAPTLLTVETQPGQHVRRAVTLVSQEVPADVHIVSANPTAQIFVDAEVRGVGEATLQLGSGRHEVRIDTPEGGTVSQTLDVGWGEQHHLLLTPSAPDASTSPLAEPALWATIGATAGALALGVLVGVLASQPAEPNGGSTGVVLMPGAHSPGGVGPGVILP